MPTLRKRASFPERLARAIAAPRSHPAAGRRPRPRGGARGGAGGDGRGPHTRGRRTRRCTRAGAARARAEGLRQELLDARRRPTPRRLPRSEALALAQRDRRRSGSPRAAQAGRAAGGGRGPARAAGALRRAWPTSRLAMVERGLRERARRCGDGGVSRGGGGPERLLGHAEQTSTAMSPRIRSRAGRCGAGKLAGGRKRRSGWRAAAAGASGCVRLRPAVRILRPVGGDGDRVLEVRGQAPVGRHDRPLVAAASGWPGSRS